MSFFDLFPSKNQLQPQSWWFLPSEVSDRWAWFLPSEVSVRWAW